jgi:hypothetical protein
LPEAPVATTAVIAVEETTENEAAAMPPKLTAVAPVKFVPVIFIVVPVPPTKGVKEVIVGAGMMYVNPAKLAVPCAVVTVTLPDAPFATIAVINVSDTTINEDAAVPPKPTAVAPVKLAP